jgi:hypothetical protein
MTGAWAVLVGESKQDGEDPEWSGKLFRPDSEGSKEVSERKGCTYSTAFDKAWAKNIFGLITIGISKLCSSQTFVDKDLLRKKIQKNDRVVVTSFSPYRTIFGAWETSSLQQ